MSITTVIIASSDNLLNPEPVGVVLPPIPGRARFLPGYDYERIALLDYLNTWPQDVHPQTWDELARALSGYSHLGHGYVVIEVDPLDLDVNEVFDHYITRRSGEPFVPAST